MHHIYFHVKNNLLKKKAKSFYFASIFLSRDCFTNCSQLYNFCRIVDDIADNNYKNKKFLLISSLYFTIKKNYASKYKFTILDVFLNFFSRLTFLLMDLIYLIGFLY